MAPPSKVQLTKPPQTLEEQVGILQRRGLSIPDPEKAAFYLSHLNYYRFRGYCIPFEADHTTHRFHPGTSFDDVLNLYLFDRELRLLILDAVERIEVSLRTQMAYHLSQNYQTAHPHLLSGVFSDAETHGRLVAKLKSGVERSQETFIRHLARKYAEPSPPIWAAVELMTIGQLSQWFRCIAARKDRQDISRIYGIDQKIMISFLHSLSLVRNHSAHHARLWNREFTKQMALPRKSPKDLVDSLLHPPQKGRMLKRLYNLLTTIAYLLDVICPGHQWTKKVKKLISSHGVDAEQMGFPADWQSRPVWKQ